MAFDFTEPVPAAPAPPQGATARASAWRYFPWFLAAGLGLVVAVNIGMAVMAVRTAPGLAVQGSFATSNAYGAIQQEARRQAGLGWTLEVALPDGMLQVRLAGPGGAPLPGARLRATATRPVGDDAPVAIELVAGPDGRFRAATAFPGQGQWDVLFIAQADGRTLKHTRRVMAP